ncbi:MBL fold metallo-hydrolase [Oscillatoria sp. FACHB-1407]|uniref:MBL fold metallo-hydrolase n=1 Tax=Oscillatoria sp. FACHB-1407 TaxID=2692847 RepID=UPI0016853A1A|nr:MBL fold metallo-hydrolase [Oscillatoria sp. FACHB-1407]MBD2463772.1 MBL fold metallo-hydrolase [Oscillatoria sp. FACHB-1407]
MKRRQFIRYAGAGLLASTGLGTVASQTAQAQSGSSVSIQWLGHTCFLFTGDGRRILVNPFRTIGCTAGYRTPNVAADLVMISSRLFDEGVTEGLPGNPRVLAEPGVYEYRGLQIQGIRMDHDRIGGRRFGQNVAWRWTQGGLTILHLGGAASPITVEQQILMGRPDVVLVPVGGGPKAYTPQEARQAIQSLNPRIVIPTHYRTQAADANACDIGSLDEFLALLPDSPVRRNGDSVSLRRADLPETGSKIEIFSYRF